MVDEHKGGPRTQDPGLAHVVRKPELDAILTTLEPTVGAGGVLFLSGAPGAGKTALLHQVVQKVEASGHRVLRAIGSPSEADLAFAGLHQLLRPAYLGIEELPDRQRDALHQAFGLGTAYGTPDPMIIGVAVLTLLSDLATRAPVLVAVDDAQWIDRDSLDALAFVARRLQDEPVTMLVAARDGDPVPGFDHQWPTRKLGPLDRVAAGQLLDQQPQPPAGRVRERILDQAEGNPLALVELTRSALDRPEAADSAAGPLPVGLQMQRLYAGRMSELPPQAQQALVWLAAAETDDPAETVLEQLPDLSDPVWSAVEEAGLIRRTDQRISFRHPLARAAVYHAASPVARSAAHRALAGALKADPDRSAWHLAAATVGTDRAVSAALEHSADRARRRGGYAASSRALERAAELHDDRRETTRLLTAATGMAVLTGQLDRVERLHARTRASTDDPTDLARAALQAGKLLALTTSHAAAFNQLMLAAEQLTTTHPAAALDALAAAAVVRFYSGEEAHRQRIGRLLPHIIDAIPVTSPPQEPPLLANWVRVVADPGGARRLAAELPRLISKAVEDPERSTLLAVAAWLLEETDVSIRAFDAAFTLWASRGPLPDGLAGVAALAYLEHGRLAQAQEVCANLSAVGATYGLDHAVACAAAIDAIALAMRGDTGRAQAQARRALSMIDPAESRSVAVYANRAQGIAAAAEGDHQSAYAYHRAVFDADGGPVHYHASYAALAELAVSAARSGHHEEAAVVIDRAACALAGSEPDTRSARVEALLHHAQAVLADAERAETSFLAALAVPGFVRWPFEHAQALLSYAEWLRRQRRIAEARPLLIEAQDTFRRLGAAPWTARAGAELRATGAQVISAEPDAFAELTPQQQQIVRLAADGLTNREVGEKLFLSPRTVSSHLYRAFPKLGITARSQLRDVLEGTATERSSRWTGRTADAGTQVG